MFRCAGIDVGCSSVKFAVVRFDDGGGAPELVYSGSEKIRKRNVKDVVEDGLRRCESASEAGRMAYVASTGEGEMVEERTGHFYSMTCHARGAQFLKPGIGAAVDIGALHAKAMIMDPRSRVLGHRMTSQCASGSGQFLENIARYLGVAAEDVGRLSVEARNPEIVSSICAVLAETDVINMVSRGIKTGDIIKGIHLSMGKRLLGLLKSLGAKGEVLATGGLSQDEGLLAAMRETAEQEKLGFRIVSHELSPLAGAIGAALWGGFRHVRLREARQAEGASA